MESREIAVNGSSAVMAALEVCLGLIDAGMDDEGYADVKPAKDLARAAIARAKGETK